MLLFDDPGFECPAPRPAMRYRLEWRIRAVAGVRKDFFSELSLEEIQDLQARFLKWGQRTGAQYFHAYEDGSPEWDWCPRPLDLSSDIVDAEMADLIITCLDRLSEGLDGRKQYS